MNQLNERFEKQNLLLEMNESTLIASAVRIKSKQRIKTPVFNYRFRSVERMIQYCTEYVESLEKRQKEKEEKLELKRKAISEFNHGFEIGKIFYESWGYEQTNLAYYQIVGFKGKSVILQRIAKKEISQTSWASGMYEPEKNAFIGKPFAKRIMPSVSYNGQISYHISMGESVGWLMEYKNSPNYCSWYA